MNNWPSEHRLALFLLVAVLAAAGGAFFLFVGPELKEVSRLRSKRGTLVEKLKTEVKDTGYPLDAARLKAHVATRKIVLDGVARKREDGSKHSTTGLIARATNVLEQATSMFDKQIRDEYTDIAAFMVGASNFAYQDELDQLTKELAHKNVHLAEEVLGIGKDTTDVDTYELLIKVWTIKRILQVIVEDHGLIVENRRLAMRPGEKAVRTPLGLMRGRGRTASQITVLPTRSYILYRTDIEPYVQEFPIRIRFQGPLPTICEAMQSLQKKGNFLTVNRFVLEQEEPKLMTARKPGSDGKVRTRNVVVTLEISSFFRPSGGGPIIRTDKAKRLPPGA